MSTAGRISPVDVQMIDDLVAQAENPFDWPAFGLKDDIRPALAEAVTDRQPVVLATLYDVAGGAPRGIGAQMLFAGAGMTGFLSGGCIEADVAIHARATLGDGAPRRIVYGEGGPIDIRLPCGSRINILLERIAPDDRAATRLLDLSEQRRQAVWLTNGVKRSCMPLDDLHAASKVQAHFLSQIEGGGICGHVEAPFALFRVFAPPLRLIIVGGDPIALAVVRLGLEMGIETTLVRPNGPAAPPFALDRYLRDDVDQAFAALRPDERTAIAILTHDLDQEHTALKAVLRTKAGYVGALGSRRRIPERNERLWAAGVSKEDTGRIHAPIGLAIGGKSPWEIAVSIVAEIVAEMD
jgi:xanthine dehydrogenase accessory factor